MSHAIVPARTAESLDSIYPVAPHPPSPAAAPRPGTACRVVAALASVVVSVALTSAVVDGMVYADDGPAAVAPSPTSA